MAEAPTEPRPEGLRPAGEAAPAPPPTAPAAPAPRSLLLRGTPVAPGLALGPIHRKDHALEGVQAQRVPLDGVETELNRFHRALLDARAQLGQLKERLIGKVPVDDARILDVHVAYLKDSVFLSDVENLIVNEQLCLEAAIAKVISDFDRIFRLVQNATLRERAVDLRDVGIRVLRQLERSRGEDAAARVEEPAGDYILVARELSIVDMFNLRGERVLGILTEEGGLTSHAAVLARSMRIPTLTAVRGLLAEAREGDFAILDASEGSVRIDPEERVREQYLAERGRLDQALAPDDAPPLAARELRTLDGERVEVSASCGNLPEVGAAAAVGMAEVGLYRTELLYLVDKEAPTLEALTRHYDSVLGQARGAPVTFRLLHADSSLEVSYLHGAREPNPALGRAGVRALLTREVVLRRQLSALLRLAPGPEVSLLVPFVTDAGEVRRVREVLFEERLELRKAGVPFRERMRLGVALETPASLYGVRDLARECDFLVLALDSVVQHLLAADRENAELARWFESLHPYVLRAVAQVVAASDELGRELSVFGYTAVRPHSLPFLLGLGLRHWIVPPGGVREFAAEVAQVDTRQARRAASSAAASGSLAEAETLVDGYRHGYAR
jgi:phosphoenolpyruvate-protein kinase (PTS system EI component)